MNIEETRRNKIARCRVDLRQMFDKGLCHFKFGGCIRYTKENGADSYAMTYREWMDSDAKYLLNQIPKDVVEWVDEEDMTDEEKAAYPTYETTGGYLKVLDESKCGQLWWNELSDCDKQIIKSIPNFDPDIFYECTGIKVN